MHVDMKFDQIFLSAQASLDCVFEQSNVISYPSPLPFCAEVPLC